MKLFIIVLLTSSLLSCERPAPAEPIAKTVQEATQQVTTAKTASNRADALEATLSDEPTRSQFLEGVSSEGAHASVWEVDGKLAMVVLEFKGETFDSTHRVYFDEGQIFFAKFYEHFDPAKMMQIGDEDYEEAAASRYIEAFELTYKNGELAAAKTVRTVTRDSARYDHGNLVEQDLGPPQDFPTDDEGLHAVAASMHELIAQLKPQDPN